jgi:hypothetical protein
MDEAPTTLGAILALQQENARLRAALKPFADDHEPNRPDDADFWYTFGEIGHVEVRTSSVTGADFRRAREALEKKE